MSKKMCKNIYIVMLTILSGFCMPLTVFSQQSDYDGAYSGIYNGTSNGYWVSELNALETNNMILTYSPLTGDLDVGFLSYNGEPFNQLASFTGTSEIEGVSYDIDITSSNGAVSGTWNNTGDLENGNITGALLETCSNTGSYSGNLSGDISGTWNFNVDSNCNINGSLNANNATRAFVGGVHKDGYIMFVSTERVAGDGFIAGGRISYSGTAGIWKYQDGSDGTFNSDDTFVDNDNVDEADSDSGCFINNLLYN